MKHCLLLVSSFFLFLSVIAQPDRWQQRVKYTMDIDVDAPANKFTGKQKLEYTNNSPDTLTRVFYHLYWNAFQPNSSMDWRSRELGKVMVNNRPDWDFRVRDRIAGLKPDEIGYQKIKSLKVNGIDQPFKYHETILEVDLTKHILPHTTTVFEMEFEAQVPVQIRRSGRDNAEGVRFSMAQWYPKLCEYDYEGWHPTPYIGREFYGVWGDYEVNINIDKSFVLGASGYLQNPLQIGYGYEAKGDKVVRPAGKKLTWKFFAPNVHDFVWAADPDYEHHTKTLRDGLVLHSLFKIDKNKLNDQFDKMADAGKERYDNQADNFIASYRADWDNVLDLAAKALPFIEKTCGKYPYKQYSFIQGGDGGMEYPMATLMKGAGRTSSIHEWLHSWYQMMLGSNESLYPWMDEGFASFAEYRTYNYLDGDTDRFPHADAYANYIYLAKSRYDEPLATHADQYNTNFAYSINSYYKGEVFVEQLGYIVGASVRDKIMLEYYNKWRYKHPNPNDFIRVAENVSGIQLDWYKTFFVNTNKTIDYAVDSLWEEGGLTKIRIKRIGTMPMPIDLQLTFKDGSTEIHNVPLNIMYGSKQAEDAAIPQIVHDEWLWTAPTYVVEVKKRLTQMKKIEIDPTKRMADVDPRNNIVVLNW